MSCDARAHAILRATVTIPMRGNETVAAAAYGGAVDGYDPQEG